MGRVRLSLLLPEQECIVATQSHEEFDRFDVFRAYQRMWLPGGVDTPDPAT